MDADLGVAVLRPEERLVPRRVAPFRVGTPRLQSEVAVAGFSFGGVLTAPTLTFGTLEDLRGLGGEEDLKRLALSPLPGDTGGPVFDGNGSVVGMLLPREDSAGRRLPEQVSFSAKSDLILAFLQQNGIRPAALGASGPMAPEDLTALAADTTVLVGCWD
jgi:S1-C subfamily serine protease